MPRKALVTGCAGFIGSHLAEYLLTKNYEVIGVDSLNDYYSINIKKDNLRELNQYEKFRFLNIDILELDKLPEVEYIFHLAAQPGVRGSWGNNFTIYVRNNIMATQRLLELSKNTKIKKFVYTSSSSIYGECKIPMKETYTPRPISPYGVTKLAAEHLCQLYWKNYGIPTVSLRYFTVYGPRQRPDMAFHKFIRAALLEEKIKIYGDGSQTRDFTFVSDIVEATFLAAESEIAGEVFNIGGGSKVPLKKAVKVICEILGYDGKNIVYEEPQKGDVKDTWADIRKAKKMLGYKPKTDLKNGIEEEAEWIKSLLGVDA